MTKPKIKHVAEDKSRKETICGKFIKRYGKADHHIILNKR
jgi:hypothetical protein